MVEITVKIIINATPKKVWKVVSEINNDPQFWEGMIKVRNISKNENDFTHEVILKNNDKCCQKIILFPMDGIHIRWTRGTINRIKDIMINPHRATNSLASWDELQDQRCCKFVFKRCFRGSTR